MSQPLLREVAANDSEYGSLARFLAAFEEDGHGEDFWQAKLVAWWEKNPFYTAGLPRGWVLEDESGIAGFLGVITTEYLYKDEAYKALNITTWRVRKEHRNQSMALFSQFYDYRDKHILFVTTPNDTVEKVLRLFGFRAHTRLSHAVFPLRRRSGSGFFDFAQDIGCGFYTLMLPNGDCRRITCIEDLKLLKAPPLLRDYLLKRKDWQYLEWAAYVNSAQGVVACFDADGRASSFVMLEQSLLGGSEVLRITDYFEGDAQGKGVARIISYIINNPASFDPEEKCRFLVFSEFCDNAITVRLPFLSLRRPGKARLYYTLPERLKDAPMLHYLAEGDFGLV